MRFSSVYLQNYRQYKNLRIDFPESEHDLQIIIGDNGTGKTNLMNAFTWCLYGTEPHLGLEDRGRGEPKLNKGAILDALQESRNKVTIQVELEIENDNDIVRVTRTTTATVRSVTDIFESKSSERLTVQVIRRNGNDSSLREDAAIDYINQLLPNGIQEYFFFDGEQLSNYFADTKGSKVKAAIYSISQLDIVTSMAERTKNATQTLRRGLGKSNPDIKAMNDAIDDAEKKISSANKAIESYERQLHEAKVKRDELTEQLRGIPDIAALENRRDQLKKELDNRSDEVRRARENLVRYAREAYIDFALYDDATKALEMISQMESEDQLPPSVDKGFLQEMLDTNICKVCGRPLSDEDHSHIVQLLQQFAVTNETSHILVGMRSELKRLVERVKNYPREREAVVANLAKANKERESTEKALADIGLQIAQYPDTEKIKDWFEQRNSFDKQVETLNQRIGSHKRGRELNETTVRNKRRDLDRAIAAQTQQRDLSKSIDFGERAEKILRAVEIETITEVRKRMSEETETLFKGLVWKDSKCDHIDLNEMYQLSLYDRIGFSCEGTCSAAERALLALSFTLSMHKVAGYNAPLFIDTPIARASGPNRVNFANTLSDVSKNKQLILTFTPDEYLESISSVFDPIAASHMRLVFNESEQQVQLRSENG